MHLACFAMMSRFVSSRMCGETQSHSRARHQRGASLPIERCKAQPPQTRPACGITGRLRRTLANSRGGLTLTCPTGSCDSTAFCPARQLDLFYPPGSDPGRPTRSRLSLGATKPGTETGAWSGCRVSGRADEGSAWVTLLRMPQAVSGATGRGRGGPGNLDRCVEWSFCLTAARMVAEQERR
jgi:hypothetical protein